MSQYVEAAGRSPGTYPPIEPYETGKLKVSDLHTLQYVFSIASETEGVTPVLAMRSAETRKATQVRLTSCEDAIQ